MTAGKPLQKRSENNMKLTMLGTGNAVVTACYNTCFVLQESGRYLLVDGGGGNTLLLRLKQADIDWRQIRTVFVIP